MEGFCAAHITWIKLKQLQSLSTTMVNGFDLLNWYSWGQKIYISPTLYGLLMSIHRQLVRLDSLHVFFAVRFKDFKVGPSFWWVRTLSFGQQAWISSCMCDRTLKTDDGMVIQVVGHAMIARLQLTRVDLINPSFSRFMSPNSSVTEDRVHQSFHPLVHHVPHYIKSYNWVYQTHPYNI